MTENVTIAIIAACSALISALSVTFINTYWIGKRLDRIEKIQDVIQSDLKEFYKDIFRIKQKLEME